MIEMAVDDNRIFIVSVRLFNLQCPFLRRNAPNTFFLIIIIFCFVQVSSLKSLFYIKLHTFFKGVYFGEGAGVKLLTGHYIYILYNII